MTAEASPKLYLASGSPRRRELLSTWGYAFRTLAVNVPEVRGDGEAPVDYVLRVSLDKARAGLAALPSAEQRDAVILAADTEVVLDDRVYGKPVDAADAHAMLRSLCGRAHEVLTAVVVVSAEREMHAINRNVVWFAAQTDEQIARYVATGEPLGRAGAYATQGRAAFFTERLEGSHTGVMGLPAYETAQLLARAGVQPDW